MLNKVLKIRSALSDDNKWLEELMNRNWGVACILIHISLLVFKARERRTAISGLMPIWPLIKRDKVMRPAPSALAASVTDKFESSSKVRLMTLPGCGGLCINIILPIYTLVLVIIDITKHKFSI